MAPRCSPLVPENRSAGNDEWRLIKVRRSVALNTSGPAEATDRRQRSPSVVAWSGATRHGATMMALPRVAEVPAPLQDSTGHKPTAWRRCSAVSRGQA